MSTTTNPVSFTIRRPTPNTDSDNEGFKVPEHPRQILPRGNTRTSSPLALPPTRPPKRTSTHRDEFDSDEETGGTEDEIITGFDRFGVTRKTPRKKEGPLIIPAVKNKDWRAIARSRNALSFVPNGGTQSTGADGSVGGLGTRDQINSGPQVSGLTFRKRAKVSNEEDEENITLSQSGSGANSEAAPEELTEDQKAIKALIYSAKGGELEVEQIAAIPLPSSGTGTPMSLAEREKAAYHRDVEDLPEPATLDAYERIPVSQFGAALLRGMGWKEGQAASRTRKGPVEPWMPTLRPQLLGIGAKEKEVLDDGSGKKSSKGKQDTKKYMPLMKVEKESSSSRNRSPDDGQQRRDHNRDRGSERRRSRERDYDSRRERERDRRRDGRDRDYSSREKEKDRDRDRDRDRRDRQDRDRDYYPSSRHDDRDGRDARRDYDKRK